ncbi:TonB-dependent receptor [Aestuariicella hydrocarbonica]|uniref:TonB-dependent receptor n=1 Tax=Pseudomaricurvus hydrocarbonicus TaxID=1470433 RepID=A0A9E5MNN0_9GAMM|nr:TonB-dependent receptor [Aestuariicella hydrocarbonica]NHO67497.1 TonB-dependent receptor [Aestuariicella hydrocarbonica]
MKNQLPKLYRATAFAALTGAIAGVSPVYAQGKGFALEEVVVTARKREESAEDIPIAISSMGEMAIEAMGATAMGDLVGSVPNLAMDPNGNSLNSWGMRGIVSVTRNAGQESGLGVYIDGVYAGRPAAFNFPMNDIQQVEVLRGPQGSLFGRNTIAGAINITTKKPSEELQGQIKLSLGNYERQDIQGSVAGPIIDGVLSGKISGFSYQQDGYVDNLYDGDSYMSDDRVGGRGALYWTPTESLEITLSADYLEQDNDQLFGMTLEPVLNTLEPGSGWYQPDPYKTNQNDPNRERIESGGTSVTVNWDLPSGHTLTSITSQRSADFILQADDDAGPYTLSYSQFEDNSDTFSQEIRIASPSADNFDYVVGYYYMDQEVDALRSTSVVGYPDTQTGIIVNSSVNSESWALFGTANFYLTDALTLSVGLRYTDEEKDSEYSQVDNVGLGFADVVFSPSQQDDAWSGDISLGYAINESINAYASVRQGVKSGGFQTDIIDFTDVNAFVFGPEEAISYELGVKGMFFERRLKVNGAVFRTDYTDMQVGQLLGLGFTTTNAGESQIDGLELEVEWLATENLALGLSLGLLDHEYTAYDGCAGENTSCKGNKLQLVSDWTASANVDYTFPLSNGSAFNAHLDWTARDNYFTDAVNDPDLVVEQRFLLNGRIGYVTADDSLSVHLWAKNLTDEEYDALLWKYPVTPLFYGAQTSGLERLIGEPRTFGVEVGYRF